MLNRIHLNISIPFVFMSEQYLPSLWRRSMKHKPAKKALAWARWAAQVWNKRLCKYSLPYFKGANFPLLRNDESVFHRDSLYRFYCRSIFISREEIVVYFHECGWKGSCNICTEQNALSIKFKMHRHHWKKRRNNNRNGYGDMNGAVVTFAKLWLGQKKLLHRFR